MSILQDMKEVAELAKTLGNLDLYTRILELRTEMNEVNEEKLRLQLRVKELEERIRTKEEMIFKGPFWYRNGDDTPHCPACFEKDNRTIHLVSLDHAADGRFHCPVCKFVYYGSGRKASVGSYRPSSRGTEWS
jgi:hypothetical protein